MALKSSINSLCLSAVRTLVKFLHTATGLELMPGVVAVIQTFGDRINFHPHIHVLMTEGGTTPDGAFHHACRFRDEVIQEIFTHEVFSLLLRKKLIGLPLVEKILNWRHTGFNVHSQVRAETRSEAERVGKYMIRPLLSLKRLFLPHTSPIRVRSWSATTAYIPMPTGARYAKLEPYPSILRSLKGNIMSLPKAGLR
jgi:hypothetical protein